MTQKNVASQKIALFAFDTTSGAPKTGDAANITVYVNKDWAGANVLGDTSATEIDATNAKGWYLFDLTQAETNADSLLFTGKSSTANISVVGQLISTMPANFSTLSVDSNGRVDVIKIAGTTQTARDVGASVIAASVTGLTASDVGAIKTKTDFLPSATAGAAGGVFIAGTNAATTVTTSFTTTFTGNLTGSVGSVSGAVGSVTGAVGSVTGNVGGNVTGSVGSIATGGIAAASFAAGAIDNAAIAADAIGSSELAASAVTEIQTGLSTLDAAGIRAAVGLASANLDTQIGTLATPTNITAGTITTVTNLTNAPTSGDLTATMKASVTTAATAATPTAAAVTGSVGSVTGLTASNLDVAVSTRLAASSYTAPPSASTIAQAVWDVLTSALTTVGSVGKLLVTNIDAAISTRSTYAGGDTAGTTTLLSRLTSTRAGLLDHLDADISTRLASGSYAAPLDAAGTRSAIGLASANLDTQLAALPTGDENADALLDRADAIETGLTPRQAMRLSAAADGGKLSGGATTTNTIRNAVADDKDRIIATVDSSGNRTAITYDLT